MIIDFADKSVFTVSTVLTKMTMEEALEMKRELEWQKCMLTVMIDDAIAKNHCKAIFEALRKISPQVCRRAQLHI